MLKALIHLKKSEIQIGLQYLRTFCGNKLLKAVHYQLLALDTTSLAQYTGDGETEWGQGFRQVLWFTRLYALVN